MSGNLTEQLNQVSGASYPELFKKFRALSAEYGLPNVISAYNSLNGGMFGTMYTPNPSVQNRRVKAIATRPADYSKDEVAEMILHPESNERELRAVERGLEYSAYPMFHVRTVYQNLLTYHNYIQPSLCDEQETKADGFWREWKLLEKLRKAVNPKDLAHEYAGRALQEGKVFVVPRISVDKPHNKVNYAFFQRLPSDWVKIVGYNNVSKYTVAFNLMYFTQVGTDWRQFGDLFEPYVYDWLGSLNPQPTVRRSDNKIVYASKTGVDMSAVRNNGTDADVYYQNGRWFYWVTLPVDRVFPMEIDDANDNVIPPFVGLFLSFIQLSQLEQIQVELLQNPLVSILHGEIPYWDDRREDTADQYKLSDAGRRMFEAFWYQMLQQNSTSGIGLFMAPLENMKMESLAEAPNATNIVAQGFTDTMAKAGLTALIPVSAESRAGAVNVSLAVESRFAQTIYTCFERMMNAVIRSLNLNHEFEFKMFGSLAEDEETEKALKEQLTLGILSATAKYNALHDRSVLDDLALSDAVINSGLVERRIPLVSGFNQTAGKSENDDGGRPQSEDAGSSDGHEGDLDSPTQRS